MTSFLWRSYFSTVPVVRLLESELRSCLIRRVVSRKTFSDLLRPLSTEVYDSMFEAVFDLLRGMSDAPKRAHLTATLRLIEIMVGLSSESSFVDASVCSD